MRRGCFFCIMWYKTRWTELHSSIIKKAHWGGKVRGTPMKMLFALMLSVFVSPFAADTAAAGSIDRFIVDQEGNRVFDCGDIYRHRQIGILRPGTVVINQAPVVLTAPLHEYSERQQQFIKACNSRQTIYAGHSQPILNIGIGATYHMGGGDTTLYGSTATSGSTSGATAGATAGVNR